MTNGTPSHLLERGFSSALSRVIALDPGMQARLGKLEGHHVCLQLSKPEMTMTFTVRSGAVDVVFKQIDASSLTIRSHAGALVKLLATGEAGIGQLRIEGDAELARWIQDAAKSFDPDLDELFARVFGDVLGFQLARFTRSSFSWAKASAARLSQQAADYLRDESKLAVAPVEMQEFVDGVDQVRARVDRLEQRLKKIGA
jgi:ubiquinone biosynthesis protein UbiJ